MSEKIGPGEKIAEEAKLAAPEAKKNEREKKITHLFLCLQALYKKLDAKPEPADKKALEKEKRELEQRLVSLAQENIEITARHFFNKHRNRLEAQGQHTEEDVIQTAQEALLLSPAYESFEPREGSMINFLIAVINGHLYRSLITPLKRKKRDAYTDSLSGHKLASDIGDIAIHDPRSEAAQRFLESRLDADKVAASLFSEDPAGSLIIILMNGLGQEIFDKWRSATREALEEAERRRIARRASPKGKKSSPSNRIQPGRLLNLRLSPKTLESAHTLEQVGAVLGITRAGASLRYINALQRARKQLKESK